MELIESRFPYDWICRLEVERIEAKTWTEDVNNVFLALESIVPFLESKLNL